MRSLTADMNRAVKNPKQRPEGRFVNGAMFYKGLFRKNVTYRNPCSQRKTTSALAELFDQHKFVSGSESDARKQRL